MAVPAPENVPMDNDSSCRDVDHDLVDSLKKLDVEKPPLKANDEDTMECDDDDDTSEYDDEDTTDDEDHEYSDEDTTDDDVDEASWLPGGVQAKGAHLYAETALNYLNNLAEGSRYEFVQAGPYQSAGISGGPILHLNFQAKAKDCPGAKVETFFAQVRVVDHYPICDCCVSLGPSEELPHWRNAELRGCGYCRMDVNHPAERCERLIMGIENEDVSWLFSDDDDS